MFPSSAAMLKNLQQSAIASPSFLMENLLQSKSNVVNGTDLTSLTWNWAASLVARQRERESENLARMQQTNVDQKQIVTIQGNNNNNRSSDLQQLQRPKLTEDCGQEEEDKEARSLMIMDNSDNCGSIGDNCNTAMDRLNAMERLSERIEMRSGSALDSNNSMDEDRNSGNEYDGNAEREDVRVPAAIQRFEFLRNHHQQQQQIYSQQQQHDDARLDRDVLDRLDNSRISEETCSCGDEQCSGGLTCRMIQEKEKPQLKFSVNAILGGNHDRRPNPGK